MLNSRFLLIKIGKTSWKASSLFYFFNTDTVIHELFSVRKQQWIFYVGFRKSLKKKALMLRQWCYQCDADTHICALQSSQIKRSHHGPLHSLIYRFHSHPRSKDIFFPLIWEIGRDRGKGTEHWLVASHMRLNHWAMPAWAGLAFCRENAVKDI